MNDFASAQGWPSAGKPYECHTQGALRQVDAKFPFTKQNIKLIFRVIV